MKVPENVTKEMILALESRIGVIESMLGIVNGLAAPAAPSTNTFGKPLTKQKRVLQDLIKFLISANHDWAVTAVSARKIHAKDHNGNTIVIKYHYSRPHPDADRDTWNGWHCTKPIDLDSGIDWHLFATHDDGTGELETFLIPNTDLRQMAQGKQVDSKGRYHWYWGHHNTNGTYGEYRGNAVTTMNSSYVNNYKLN